MTLWEHTGEALIGGAEITSDVILAPEIEMPWENDKVENHIDAQLRYRTCDRTQGLSGPGPAIQFID
jgi:hypothetical protein